MMNTYPMVYLGSMFASVLATPLVVKARPALQRAGSTRCTQGSSSCVPRIGGVAIIIAMLIRRASGLSRRRRPSA